MKKCSALTVFLAILLLLPLCLPFTATAEGPSGVTADAYMLMEAQDRHTVAEANSSARLPPASTTKILTCLVALEHADSSETVTVSENADRTEGSSAYLRAGEKISVKDLLYCLMLSSANDAAIALAEHIAGSVEAFAELMNEKAQSLGLLDSHFTNPHGLDDEEHYVSARDLAVLTCAALQNDRFAQIVSTKRYDTSTEPERQLINHNRLLFTLNGCIGVKTGYTVRSGRCLVSACRREDTVLVCVTLGCHDDWAAHARLYDYGFSTVKRYTVQPFEFSLPLVGCDRSSVLCSCGGGSLLADAGGELTLETICPHMLFPPLQKGEKVGEVRVLLDGRQVALLPLTAGEDIPEPMRERMFSRFLRWLRRLFGKR